MKYSCGDKIDPDEFRVWVHTCPPRKKSLEATVASLDASDLKGRYDILEGPLADGPTIHKWWSNTMTRLATEPCRTGKPPRFIIRLEDDIIVNKHILHNCCTWQALWEDDFGFGQLFNWDGDYPPRPHVTRVNEHQSIARLDMEFYGAQGQLFRADLVPRVAAMFPKACLDLYGTVFNMDGMVVRCVCSIDGYVGYLHVPSLVNCHIGSAMAASGYSHGGHFSHQTFDPDWKRESDPKLQKPAYFVYERRDWMTAHSAGR